MVTASASTRKKAKKAKKSAKRRPVNLQSNFNRKCVSDSLASASASQDAAAAAYEAAPSADMFPANAPQLLLPPPSDASSAAAGDGSSCGDFHLHRYE